MIRIFIKDFLKVVRTQKTYLKFKTTLYKVVWSLLINKLYITYLIKKISYISYVVNLRREFSWVQVENISYECLLFGRDQIMLGITFFGLRDTALHSITESGSRDVVRLYNTSDWHFRIYTNNLNNKKNSGFFELRVHCVVVLWLRTIVRRSRNGRKMDGSLVWTGRLWITLHLINNYFKQKTYERLNL